MADPLEGIPRLPLGDAFDDGTMPTPKELDPLPYSFNRQEVHVDVDFLHHTITGKSEIWFTTFDSDNLPDICIDARQCHIDIDNITIEMIRDGVRQTPVRVLAAYRDPYETLALPEGHRWDARNHDLSKLRMLPLVFMRNADSPAETRDMIVYRPLDGALRVSMHKDLFRRPGIIKLKTSMKQDIEHHDFVLSIPFKTTRPRDGVQFVGVEEGDQRYPHMYTKQMTLEPGIVSSIFPCIDDPGTLCDWKLHITCPKTLGLALRPSLAVDGRSPENDWRYSNLTEADKMLDMVVICTGSMTDQIDHPEDDTKTITSFTTDARTISADKLAFAVGPFEHVDLWTQFRTDEDDEKMGTNAIRVHGFCLPGRAEEVRNTCAPMSMAADFLTINYSAYPYESFKLCFVDNMATDVVPQCSMAFVSNRLLYPEDIIDTEIETTEKLVYGLAVQWSGIQLFPNMRSDSWITVGLAWFMTDTFMRKLCGNNDHRFRIKTLVDRLIEVDIDRPSMHETGRYLHLGTWEQEFLAHKARLVMFVLDKRLIKASGGSTGLTRIMSRLFLKARMASMNADRIVSTEGFRKLCEKQGRSKLEAFWKEWVFGTGCPKFEVTPRFNKKRLCVEMTIRQTHAPTNEPPRYLDKNEFLRILLEKRNGMLKMDPPTMFTGPITIRIHEADGTPYEHIVEIRDDTGVKRATKFEIAYNTKYKRLKRTRRMKEKQTIAGKDENGAGDEGEVLLYSLGDTLQTPTEAETFMLREWDEAAERQMDSESYEWIRMDTDFEWIGAIRTNMPGYMYISQLQQDRDVVAQQDTLVYIRRERPHPVASTFLVRTLMDTRYFHGIRTMAAELLTLQATEPNEMRGMMQLMAAFKHFFCYEDSGLPKPNDFSNKQQYRVQKTIPLALSRVRDRRGKCPVVVQQFLLDLLTYNNNSDNLYSDTYYVAMLITALGTAFVPDRRDAAVGIFGMGTADDEADEAEQKLLERALEQINRFIRMDEWTNSHRNLYTLAGLEAKRMLMKAEVIPMDVIDFVQYLQDETLDEVRIKAFEALVDLGQVTKLPILKLLLSCLSTDRSPFVRDRLIKALSKGLAGIAFGETVRAKVEKPPKKKLPAVEKPRAADGSFLEFMEEDEGPGRSDSILAIDGMDIDQEPEGVDASGGLVIVENTADEMEARKAMFARKQNLDDAVVALRKEFEENYTDMEQDIRRAVWKAVNSPTLGIAERCALIELCSTMFEESDHFIITLKYPREWTVAREKVPGRCLVKFTPYFRTEPKKPVITVKTQIPSAAGVESSPMLTSTPSGHKKLIINRSGSISLKAKPSMIIKTPTVRTPLKSGSSFSTPARPTISLVKHDQENKPIATTAVTESPVKVSASSLASVPIKRTAAELNDVYGTPAPKVQSNDNDNKPSNSNKRPLDGNEDPAVPKRIRVGPKLSVSVQKIPQMPSAPERLVVTFKSRTLRYACAHRGVAPQKIKHSASASTSSLSSIAASPVPTKESLPQDGSALGSSKDKSKERRGLPGSRPGDKERKIITGTSMPSGVPRSSIKIPGNKFSLKAGTPRSSASPKGSPGPPTLKALMAGTPKGGRKPLPGGSGGGPGGSNNGSSSGAARNRNGNEEIKLAGSKHERDGERKEASSLSAAATSPVPSTPGTPRGSGLKTRIKITFRKPSLGDQGSGCGSGGGNGN